MAKKEKVLIVTDSPAICTGLARVGRELGYRFHQRGYETAFAGWFHPNLQPVRAITSKGPKKVSVCTRCLRSGKVKKAV